MADEEIVEESNDQVESSGPAVEEEADSELGERELDFILDIPLELSVELGKSKMLIYDLLQLGQGSIVELNKLAGEPLEVYVE